MAKYGSDSCVLLVDGYNVLGVTTQLEHTVEALIDETTSLGDAWPVHEYANVRKAALTQEGFFDDAALSSNAALNEKQGNERVLVLGFEGNTVGKQFSGYSGAMQVDYKRIATRGQLHRVNASYQGSGIVEDGLILHAHTARTADGNTEATPVQNGSSSADGAAAYLEVSALTLGGYDNVTIRVRERNGGVWGTLATFTVVASAPTAERITVAGTVEQDLAVSWTFNGAGADPSITFLVGFVRN